jgi:hypothetical protein
MRLTKVQFSMVFGQSLEGFAMTPDAICYYPDCVPADAGEPDSLEDTKTMTQDFTLTISLEEGETKSVLRSEHGCQKLDDVVQTPFTLSFTAFAGSAGDELFRFVLMTSDSTAQVVGFACGTKPCFRSFMPLRGTLVEE